MFSRFSFSSFRFVYWIIAIATAQHTAWGAATTMQGAMPDDPALRVGWWLQGGAFAIAIDYTMVMVAAKLRGGASASQQIGFWKLRVAVNWYTVTFVAVAAASSYFQLLYAWTHAELLNVGDGVTTDWVARLQSIIDARIVIAPFILPAIALLYTVGGLGKGGEAQPKQRNVAQSLQRSRNAQPSERISVDYDVAPGSSVPALPQPDPQQLRDATGILIGYICPGCHKSLSRSGWSRHREKCKELNYTPRD